MEELALKEYEALQAEKRDRMQTRLQVWSVFIGLVGAFGLASLQTGLTGYVLVLYPLLGACVARYSGHNETVIEKLKSYLHIFEQTHGYRGYEQYNREVRHARSGNQVKALRDALILTEMLATIVIVIRLLNDHLILLTVGVIVMELVAIVGTWQWLRERCSS